MIDNEEEEKSKGKITKTGKKMENSEKEPQCDKIVKVTYIKFGKYFTDMYSKYKHSSDGTNDKVIMNTTNLANETHLLYKVTLERVSTNNTVMH